MKSPNFCALFDLDDTMVATGPAITLAVNGMVAPETVEWRGRVPSETVRAANGVRVRLGLPALAEKEFWEAADVLHWPAFVRAAAEGRALVPGVRELVESLLAEGAPVAVVTNSQRARAARLLEISGLGGFGLEVVCCCDGHGYKPAPAPYLEALRRLGGAPSRAVFFGDDPTDFAGTANAGIGATVRVLPEGGSGTAGARVAVRDYRGITPDALARFVETGEFRI